jgi:hypothetical protein
MKMSKQCTHSFQYWLGAMQLYGVNVAVAGKKKFEVEGGKT